MNTLNNQQINPGNRVDFSRIRRFAKGGVPKYQNAPGTLKYNWDPFYGQFQNNSLSTMNSNTSIPWNRTWSPNETYNTVQDLENSQNYKDFTNYVINNSNNEQVIQYLKHLDTQARKSGSSEGLLFTDANQTTLRDGWNNEYFRLRNDDKYGYFHLTPEFAESPTEVVADQPEVNSDLTEDKPQQELSTIQSTQQSFTPVDFLPQYQKGKWTGWEHLPFMLGNNLSANWGNYRTAMGQKTPMPEAPQEQGIVTNDYVGKSIMQQQLNEARARNASLASSTSNIDDSTRIQQQFESDVAMPAEMQMAQRQSDEFNRTSQNLQDISNRNSAQRTLYANQKNANLTALHNSLLNEKQKLTSSNATELNSFIQNLATSRRQYDLQEAYNKDLYNQNVNTFLTSQQQAKAYNQYQNALTEGWKKDTGYEDLYNYLVSGGEPILTNNKEQLDTLMNNKYDLTKVRPILEGLASQNQYVQNWLSDYDSYKSSQKLAYDNAYREIAKRNAFAGLLQKQYYAGPNDPSLKRNMATLYPGYGGYYKKGGKVEDRFIKYIEHNRKLLKDMNEGVRKTHAEANKKLARELDALDKETLLLLRSIFK